MHYGEAKWTQQVLTFLFQREMNNCIIENNFASLWKNSRQSYCSFFLHGIRKKEACLCFLIRANANASNSHQAWLLKGYARHTASPIQAKLIMIKSSSPGRGSWKYTSKIFLIHPQSSAGKLHWEGLNTHNFSCLCLTPVSQFWITAHEGLYFGSSAAYLWWYDQFHCLFEDCIRIADSFSLSAQVNMGPVGRWAEFEGKKNNKNKTKTKKHYGYIFFPLSSYVQVRTVFKEKFDTI